MVFLKEFLLKFGEATRLKVNYEKSNLISINIVEDKVNILLETLNCQTCSRSFTYLCLPLSTTKPRKEFFMFVILSAQRRFSSCSMYLSYVHLLPNYPQGLSMGFEGA
jgi:hypothetical protein